MTFEQALLTALASVTTALCFVCKLLWAQAVDCKMDRRWLRERVEKLEGDYGVAKGKVEIYSRCHQPACPFRENDEG